MFFVDSFSKCAFIFKMWKLCERFREVFFHLSEKHNCKQKSVHLLKRYRCHDNFIKVNLLISSNIKYIGISNDTRSAPYTLVTSDLRRPSWHEKKSLFENRRHDTLVGLPTKFHSILESLFLFLYFSTGIFHLWALAGPNCIIRRLCHSPMVSMLL